MTSRDNSSFSRHRIEDQLAPDLHISSFVTVRPNHFLNFCTMKSLNQSSLAKVLFGMALLVTMPDRHFTYGTIAQATTKTRPTTLVGSLASSFEKCENSQDIDMDCLMNACTSLRDAMLQMGQDGNARDLDSNIRKIQQARIKAPKTHQRTLRALLEYEKEQGVKLPDGRLRNPSAAVGLLWIRRSVAFQRRMNSILLEHPHLSSTEAALQAYQHELEPYHSWSLQRIYKMAFRASTPRRSKILARLQGDSTSDLMGTQEEASTIHDLRSLVAIWNPVSW